MKILFGVLSFYVGYLIIEPETFLGVIAAAAIVPIVMMIGIFVLGIISSVKEK